MPNQTVADTLQKWNEIKIENVKKMLTLTMWHTYMQCMHAIRQTAQHEKYVCAQKKYKDEAVLCLHIVCIHTLS